MMTELFMDVVFICGVVLAIRYLIVRWRNK